MNPTKTFFLSAFALASLCASAQTRIVNLRTEALDTPMGIDDARPSFSWQMSSDRYGASQKAYRLTLAGSPEALESGIGLMYDSGLRYTDQSLNIPYEGRALSGSTRYWWQVSVTDDRNGTVVSEPTWFETGLMEKGWSNAQWIGSSETGASKYRALFNVDYDVEVKPGGKAGFLYSAQDRNNWICATLDASSAPSVEIDYCVEGEVRHAASLPVAAPFDASAKHHILLKVSTPGYHLKSFLEVEMDGRPLTDNRLVIDPYPGGERVHDWARLHCIGFRQPKGHSAKFSDITISEPNWGETLYKAPETEYVASGPFRIWEPYGYVSAPMLRREINIGKAVKNARLYATARGIYEFYINGERVGEDYFAPGWTDYRYRIMYSSYDITDMLKSGENAFGAMLGTGWWSELNIFTAAYMDAYGPRQSLMAKILLQYEDGTEEVVVTDGRWRCYDEGPVVRNGFQCGEDYDARKEVPGWKDGGFDDSAWAAATVYARPAENVEIQAYVGLPIRISHSIEAVSVTEPVKGTFVYDFGQNVVGVPRLEGMRGRSGQTVNLRYGEMIYPETIPTDPVPPYTVETYTRLKGQVYTENYRGALSIDNYIMRGDRSGEDYQPIFTDHGFRYVSITGLDKALPLASVKALVMDSIGDCRASYETSDADINRLFENILWGQRGNFQAVPTDCPQRDERQGWTGDAQVFARAATYFSPWVDKFYDRWFYALRDNQATDGSYFNYVPVIGAPGHGYSNDSTGWMGWADAGIIVPYQVFEQFGDIKVLKLHYASMLEYMDYLDRRSQNYLQPAAWSIGDHLAIERTNPGITNTAYYAYDAMMMSKIARALGNTADEARFSALFDNIKAAFNKEYGQSLKTQTALAIALRFNLLDGEARTQAVNDLVANIEAHGNTLTTGFIGTPYLNIALSENGRDDVAYRLFEQRAYPSWLYPVLQGATTMWERWNSFTIENGFGPVDMNSFNHYAYGAIGEWMFSHSLGIQRDEDRPAYKHFILQPKVDANLDYAKGGFETPYGPVRSGWEWTGGGYIYRVEVPANTTASLTLQAGSISGVSVLKGAEGVGPLRSLKGRVMAELQPGVYEIKVKAAR